MVEIYNSLDIYKRYRLRRKPLRLRITLTIIFFLLFLVFPRSCKGYVVAKPGSWHIEQLDRICDGVYMDFDVKNMGKCYRLRKSLLIDERKRRKR